MESQKGTLLTMWVVELVQNLSPITVRSRVFLCPIQTPDNQLFTVRWIIFRATTEHDYFLALEMC